MLTVKIVAFAIFAVIALIILYKNTNRWSERFQKYMLSQTLKVFGSGEGWDEPWAKYLSKVMVVFFGLMFIVGIYVAIFSM